MIDFLFGSPVFVIDLSDEISETISTETENATRVLNNNLSKPWDSNILSTFDKTNKNNIIKQHCPNLDTYILKSVNRFLKELKVDPPYSFINIYDSWVNYAERGMYQEVHSHPYADLSGVFYVETLPDSGDLYFIAPSTAYCHSELIYRSDILRDNIKIQPKKNRLVLFPSWLQHGTLANKNENIRISISFNIKLIP